MYEEMIVRHCSPTLAGMKAGNMFSVPYECPAQLLGEIRQLNWRLKEKGLRMIPLKISKKRALLYLYRESRLTEDFSDELTKKLLEQEGYENDRCKNCIARLAGKIRETDCIPHEVGLFLGYPSEDVDGFIRHKACDYKCVGCWKVYGDEEKAQKTFAAYKKCTEIYCARWAAGMPLEQLAVAG